MCSAAEDCQVLQTPRNASEHVRCDFGSSLRHLAAEASKRIPFASLVLPRSLFCVRFG